MSKDSGAVCASKSRAPARVLTERTRRRDHHPLGRLGLVAFVVMCECSRWEPLAGSHPKRMWRCAATDPGRRGVPTS